MNRFRCWLRAFPILLLASLGACSSDGDSADADSSMSSGSDASTTLSDSSGGGDSGDGSSSGAAGPTVGVSGDAFVFGPSMMLAGATVSILEMPEQTTTTDANGHFAFDALPAGALATFVFDLEGYPRTLTKTFTLPDEGETIERISFQVPNNAMFALLASVVMIEPDPAACQIASTVTRVGKSVYDEGAHGEAGATVTIDPPLPPELGPVYFNAGVIPELGLTETSEDGGILYVNVPPGSYRITAEKPGVEIVAVDVVCEPNVLVNPSPPFGLQVL
jgi:hypothetical protein